jgi:hypothetical protein
MKCKRIQQELLRRADPQLFQYLTDLSIEPQIYALYSSLLSKSFVFCVVRHANTYQP